MNNTKIIILLISLLVIPNFIHAQSKQLNLEEQKNELLAAYDKITANEVKLAIIDERTANIPEDQIANSEIQDLITKYSNEIELAQRRSISIEHYLKSINHSVEIPSVRFNRFSQKIKDHINQEPLYTITGTNNSITE